MGRIKGWEYGFYDYLDSQASEVLSDLKEKLEITEEIEAKLVEAIDAYNETFAAQSEVEVAGAAS